MLNVLVVRIDSHLKALISDDNFVGLMFFRKEVLFSLRSLLITWRTLRNYYLFSNHLSTSVNEYFFLLRLRIFFICRTVWIKTDWRHIIFSNQIPHSFNRSFNLTSLMWISLLFSCAELKWKFLFIWFYLTVLSQVFLSDLRSSIRCWCCLLCKVRLKSQILKKDKSFTYLIW